MKKTISKKVNVTVSEKELKPMKTCKVIQLIRDSQLFFLEARDHFYRAAVFFVSRDF